MSNVPLYNVIIREINSTAQRLEVKVEVNSYAGLRAYMPVTGEKTTVIPTKHCSKEDVAKIKDYCNIYGMFIINPYRVDGVDTETESESVSSNESDDLPPTIGGGSTVGENHQGDEGKGST